MGNKSALVVGGTGPTGPVIVNGLLRRGYDVSIMHRGTHEAEFDAAVEHIHDDPNFADALGAAMGRRPWWDLVVFSYGRLAHGVAAAKGRTGRLIAIGGLNGAPKTDPRVGLLGQSVVLREEHLVGAAEPYAPKLAARMTQARDALFAAHSAGHYDATYLSFPSNVYGPRAPGPREWCIVRRVLDGRRAIVVPDGGMTLIPRGYGENLGHGVLLAVDHQGASAGRHFALADLRQFTLRQLVDAIAEHMNHDWEVVEMPYELALPSRAFNFGRTTTVPHTGAAEAALGYRDVVPADAALRATVDWLLANRPQPGGAVEQRIGAVFDYEKEDQLIDVWQRALAGVRDQFAAIGFPDAALQHVYDHPKAPAAHSS
jgi:nucleoside-diphosphate-sugar epimerase